MLTQYLELAMTLMAILILLFAYVRNNNLARLSVFTIFGAYILTLFLGQLSSLLTDIQILGFLIRLLNQIAGLIDYAEIILLLVLLLAPKPRSGNRNLKTALIIYIVIKALLVFGIL
jgi:hypothetical protein